MSLEDTRQAIMQAVERHRARYPSAQATHLARTMGLQSILRPVAQVEAMRRDIERLTGEVHPLLGRRRDIGEL